ncbi:uncharacterized protein MELLADRAFT_60776 [Melampsora larici-populina 98AG31]|uniref:Uncharacterized protein n=1 Tax=Melampsora larici-populina (strain 98AG31 / pathotype 3-4-7) TaxID=747676 RepID=F4RC83_MELLP|nr:uncharacterized protein MELLADRAFT_60776 [Melampsora larici-populina 98AG31]EGG09695.1 hypothetical protein MELLADRAFT_60776 [Melampsora larici-populina 98AG31]
MSGSSLKEDIEKIFKELAVLKNSLKFLEDLVPDHTHDVRLIHPVIEYLTKELAVLKAHVQNLDTDVTDLMTQSDLEYQRLRSHEMTIQQLIDASPAHSHIDLETEIENFDHERYANFRRRHQNDQTPVSGSNTDL